MQHMMKRTCYLLLYAFLCLQGCGYPAGDSVSDSANGSALDAKSLQRYLDFSQRDDQKTYMEGLIKFIKDVDQVNF